MQQNLRTNEQTFFNTIKETMLTVYKTFVRSHLNYANIIYYKPFNDAFKEKLEKVQQSEPLITGAIKAFSRERLYKKLGLESLCDRRWYRTLVFFKKWQKVQHHRNYNLVCFLIMREHISNTRSSLTNTIKTFTTQKLTFAQLFFLFAQKNGTN